jgi:hypothetical protein
VRNVLSGIAEKQLDDQLKAALRGEIRRLATRRATAA